MWPALSPFGMAWKWWIAESRSFVTLPIMIPLLESPSGRRAHTRGDKAPLVAPSQIRNNMSRDWMKKLLDL